MTSFNGDGGLFCLDAPGGTGKTFLLGALLSAVRSNGDIAIATALSAVASKLLEGGSTLHSKLKVPIKIQEESVCQFTKHTAIGQMFKIAKLLVIDEVTMGHKHIYEAIDRTLREVREQDKPMGGLCTVFAGDWRQTLVVIPGGSEAQIVDACLKYSYLWQYVKVFHLRENMRVKLSGSKEVKEFAEWLLTIGNGTCGENKLSIPRGMLTDEDNLESLTKFVFPDIELNYKNTKWMAERAILCPTNNETEEVNNYILTNFPGEELVFKSIDITEENSPDYTPEFLNTLKISGIAPHELKLKLGVPVMLLRNIDPANGHCNGVKYVINNINKHIIELRAIAGANIGSCLFLPRIVMISQTATLPFTLRRRQYPIPVSYTHLTLPTLCSV